MPSLSYSRVGTGISVDGSLFFNFYGKDFNPTVPSIPGWNTATAYGATSSFNLAGFQPGHEVGCYVWNVKTDNVVGNLYVESFLQAYKSGSWSDMWDYSWSYYTSGAADYMGYMYFGVDYDEIRNYATQYRVLTNRELGSYGENGNVTNFTVSNLSFDSTRHPSGYLWVEGTHLCYTDSSYSSTRGYKHVISYDEGYSGGSGEPGYIWLPNSTADKSIHYIDAYGTERRTYQSDSRYGGVSYDGDPGYIRVPTGDAENGYAHLCFIDYSGQKRRILNGPV